MNIFYLHRKVKKCAKYHVDRHIVKMPLETAQLLCSAIIMCGGEAPYKLTHKNHPCAIWARKSKENWLWLKELGLALCNEYTFRYEKKHKCQEIIESLTVPELPEIPFSEPPQCMPDIYKCDDSREAYRELYRKGKSHLHYWKSGKPAWKNRDIPRWL